MRGAEGTALLAAAGLRKRFGALVVLNSVDFTLRAGDAVGIVGPNGAGKTTLLSVFAGSQRLDAGTIHFRGADVTSAGAAARCRLGIARAHQVPKPFGGMTVFENVLVGASAGGRRRRRDAYRAVVEVLELCELEHLANRPAESLGLLHRKRLELARALATDPQVLLLDEIGAGLTDEEAAELVTTIREVRRDDIAIVWIEHIVHVLIQVTERLVCMDSGRVIADGAPDAVMKDAAVIDAYLGRTAPEAFV
ncbi:MAG TPA: ABC transporter ATP-binding protein [Gaiellaceae bacterium]|nr:ABC transporter ATP-binding protein [Gaiellaceae bacterium]